MSERLFLVEPGDDENRVLLAKRFNSPHWSVWSPEDLAARLQKFFENLEVTMDENEQPFVEYWP